MDGMLALALGAAAFGVMLYLLLVVWPQRVQRRRKELNAPPEPMLDDRLARALDAAARIAGQPTQSTATPAPSPTRAPTPAPTPVPTPAAAPLPPVTAPSLTSVAEVLMGIRLPHELAPLTTMAPRAGAGDRVAFWTDDAGAELVGPAFVDELRRIGCTVTQIDVSSYAVIRDNTRAMVVLHADGQAARIDDVVAFPSVPRSVVVEIWLPA